MIPWLQVLIQSDGKGFAIEFIYHVNIILLKSEKMKSDNQTKKSSQDSLASSLLHHPAASPDTSTEPPRPSFPPRRCRRCRSRTAAVAGRPKEAAEPGPQGSSRSS